MSDSVKSIFQSEAAAISSIPEDQDFEGVVDLIHEKIHQKGGKVIVSGMGKAGQVANNIALSLSKMDINIIGTDALKNISENRFIKKISKTISNQGLSK